MDYWNRLGFSVENRYNILYSLLADNSAYIGRDDDAVTFINCSRRATYTGNIFVIDGLILKFRDYISEILRCLDGRFIIIQYYITLSSYFKIYTYEIKSNLLNMQVFC